VRHAQSRAVDGNRQGIFRADWIKPVKLFRFFLNHSRKIVFLSVVVGALSGVCNAALLGVINFILKGNGGSAKAIAIFAALCVALPVTRYFSELMLNRLGQDALYTLRLQLSRQILAAPLRHLEQIGAHRLLASLTEDVPAITNSILTIPLLLVNAGVVIGCIVYMGIMSWLLLVVVLFFMAAGIASYQIPIFRAQKILALARTDADEVLGHFRALTEGIKELKLHGERRRSFVADVLEVATGSFRRHNIAGMKTYTAAASWGQSLVFVVVGLIIILLPMTRPISGATLTGYTLALLYLMTPLQIIMNSLPGLGRASVSLSKVEKLGFTLAGVPSEGEGPADPFAAQWRKLQFENVTHRYHREDDAGDFVVGPINLTLEAGELVFIVGGNGSGKTTLVKLLTGLYVPEGGCISLDGKPVDDLSREGYRQYFSAVFSDFFLFERMLGLVGPELDQQAGKYLNNLKLSHKVTVRDGKLSTTELSQGQRKRLALLTAYLEDRPIYVFDEWAADQDPYFKSIFYLELLPELKARGKTVFVISHDERFYHIADRTIKLDDGRVVSQTLSEPSCASLEPVSKI